MAKLRDPLDKITVSAWFDGSGNLGSYSVDGAETVEYLLATPERKAAGELLAACKRAVVSLDDINNAFPLDVDQDIIDLLDAAIAAATGDTDGQ